MGSRTAAKMSRRSVLAGGGATAAAAVIGSIPPAPALAASLDLFYPTPNSLVGTTIMITGANTGLGLESAKRLCPVTIAH